MNIKEQKKTTKKKKKQKTIMTTRFIVVTVIIIVLVHQPCSIRCQMDPHRPNHVLASQKQATTSLTSSMATAQTVTDIEQLVSVEGHSTQLPCDVTPPKPGEQVYLVLWYRQDEGGEPIYSYDARSGGPENGRRWSDVDRGFGNRAHFRWRHKPAHLHIDKIRAMEAGIYRCRVDFKTAPTRNSLLNLTVVVPPNTPTIFDETGRQVREMVGPYMEGDTIVLKCITSGGNPMPQVTWWRDSHLIDSSYETTFSRTVQNTLSVPQVTREDLGAILTCQASNNNVSAPASSRVAIDLKFRPESVSILAKREPLSAGKEYLLECKSFGSRPPATVTWWKNSKFMGKTQSTTLDGGNVTRSILKYLPRPSDHGKSLTCRSENTELSHAAIEDHWKLTVHHAPVVALSFGANLNPENIAEGNDVYFECKIVANPDVYKVVWLHDDVMVLHDKSRGIIISGSSLVLQKVTRKQAGSYSCVASNLEGDTQSNIVHLNIMYKPICGNFHKVVQGVGRGQLSRVLCPIESHPPPTQFLWTFNNSMETHEVSEDNYTFNETHSLMLYEPDDDDDFGYVYCWATNIMGRMTRPCVFQLIPAGPPDAPTNCSVVNQTTESLEVECLAGFDGGLKQFFMLEVTDLQTGVVLANASDTLPEFQVSGLNSGRGLKITISSANSNGRSKSVVLEGFTLKVAELQVESPVPLEFTPVLGILVGVVVTLMLVAFVIMLILRLKYKTSKGRHHHQQQQQHQQTQSSGKRRQDNVDKALPNDRDAEEYFCLRSNPADSNLVISATTHTSNSSSNSSKQHDSKETEHNPDVVPPHRNVHGPESESLRSGTPVKSDVSGGSVVSGYGTGCDSGSDKTPPYLPRNQAAYATMCRLQQDKQLHCPADGITYAQLTLPSPRGQRAQLAAGSTGPYVQQQRQRCPSSDKVIYSQIDPQLSRLAAPANGNGHLGHVTVNPYHNLNQEDPASWAPLLGNRHQQESTL